MLNYTVRIINNNFLAETEELIKILVTPIKAAQKKSEIVIHGLISDTGKQKKLNRKAERHHYSMFSVGRSMFDVDLLEQT